MMKADAYNELPKIIDGNIVKPKFCQYCCLHGKLGFTPDGIYRNTRLTPDDISKIKIVVVQEQPSTDEVTDMFPMGGLWGWSRWAGYFVKAGFDVPDVGFSYLRRCFTGLRDGKPDLTPAEAKDAAAKCRHYDALVSAFKPDCAVVTNTFQDAMKFPAFYRMTLADLTKAKLLADTGARPLVLMGQAAMQHYLPDVPPNIKTWGGSFFEIA